MSRRADFGAVGKSQPRLDGAAKLTGTASVLSAEKADEFFEPAWTGDPSALMADTGWRPATDLAKGLAATSAWYRAEKWI